MKKLQQATIVILLSCFCICCKTKDSKTKNEYSLLENTNSKVHIQIDTTVSGFSPFCSYYSRDTTEYLLYYNYPNNTLLFFDVKSQKLVHSIAYPKQGDNGIPNINSIVMKSPDSIFVMPSYIFKLYLTDWSGKIKRTYDLHKDSKISTTWESEPSRDILIYNNICFFNTAALANPFINPKSFFKIPIGAKLDLKSEKLDINLFKYPEVYQTDNSWGFYHTFCSQVINKNGQMVVSFPLDPMLYVMNLNGKVEDMKNAKSDYFESQVNPYKEKDAQKMSSYFVKENAYETLHYDSYRNVYYRFATQGIDTNKELGKRIYSGLYKPLSVIIMDKNLKKIGETLLPSNKHYYPNAFVGKNGFYISESHPDNLNRDENKLVFSCYEMIKN